MRWSGRCTCGDPYPCNTRALCLKLLGSTEPEPGPAVRTVVAWLVSVAGIVMLTGAAAWWVLS
jgi:hypothetical protein